MKNRIKKFASLLKETTENIKNDLIVYFNSLDYSKPNKGIQILEIKSENDLDKIIYGNGFYIILTNYPVKINNFILEYNGLKAIYRGHSCRVKKRLYSHLANNEYNSKAKNEKYGTFYKACLKMGEDGINGININQEPYKNWRWSVIVHKMEGSSSLMREQVEKAFDIKYNKPNRSKQ